MEIKRIETSGRNEAVKLISSVFMQFEAPDYSDEGVKTFNETVIYNDEFFNRLVMYGAYIETRLVGVIATMNEGKHIALFFVDGSYHRQGIGKMLFEKVLEVSTENEITVNSSPYAVEVYRHLGFTDTAEEQITDGMRYTPMVYRKSMYLYSESELNEYEAYIKNNLGEYNSVFHELASPDIHLDVIIIPPAENHPFYKMVTMGMGAYSMNVPEELKEYELDHAELVLYLPENWEIKSQAEAAYWPIRYMKMIGRLPIECNTWLGFGHTIHGNSDKGPFADNTKLNSIMLLNACNLENEKMELTLSTGKRINFYQIFPLYQEELDYKLENSLEDLLDLFSDEDLFPVLNIDRKNYCDME